MASTNKLYPPIIDGVLPAFYKDKDIAIITIPFSMNQMVSPSSVKSMFLRLKTVQTNEVKYCKATSNFNLNEGIATFTLTSEDLNQKIFEGIYYKAQLAYCEYTINNNPTVTDAGYFSTVGIIKCIAKPKVSIANFNVATTNLFTNRLLGVYEQDKENGDGAEKVYSYQFIITDKNDEPYIDSGVLLHNSNTDTDMWSSTDEYLTHKILNDNEIYYVRYIVTTVNHLTISSPLYHIITGESINMAKEIQIIPQLNYDEGYIELSFKGPTQYTFDDNVLTYIKEANCSGLYLLSRGHFQNDYMVWEDIARFKLYNEKPSIHKEYDFTIEQGITYKYRLQQYNTAGVYSNPVYSKEIYADFEDMFLYDGVRQLKVRFNPKVSSFKVDIPEQKLETIGSKYPFIFRNGNVYYHEFPISGLISYQLDEAKLFLNDDEVYDGQVLDKNNRTQFGYQPIPQDQVRLNKDLTSNNLMSERYFKLKVLEWLTNGEIKLFRSPGEGNYLVRLLNTSMTPNDTLGRMLHTFNTTAYEIADMNYDNLLSYNIININNPSKVLYSSNSIEFFPEYNDEGAPIATSIYINQDGSIISGFTVEDCIPGDQIIITYHNGTTETITIGVTGSYTLDNNTQIIDSIEFIANSNGDSNYPHIITINSTTEWQDTFDMIDGVQAMTIIGSTYYGPILNLVDYVRQESPYNKLNIKIGSKTNAYKIKLINLEQLHFKTREIIPLYQISANQYATTPFGKGYLLNELTQMTEVDQTIINRFAIFAIYIPTTTPPVAIAHLLTPNETQATQDKIYNEMYPDWEFQGYYDPRNNSELFSADKLDTRFAIGMERTSANLNYVELRDIKETTVMNAGNPRVLYLGNGLILEPIFRILVIDYNIEASNSTVAAAKATYLNAKQALQDDYITYLDEYATAYDEYNAYILQKQKYDDAMANQAELTQSLNILKNILSTNNITRDRFQERINNIVSAINQYITDYSSVYSNLETDEMPDIDFPMPNLLNSSGFELNEPETTTDPDRLLEIQTALQSNIAEQINSLINHLNTINNNYSDTLANYATLIPDINDLINLLPEGWDLTLSTMSEAEIVSSLTDILINSLKTMYDYLHKNNSINIFNNESYLPERLKTQEWSSEDAVNLLEDQEDISSIELFTQEILTPNIDVIYDKENSSIIHTYYELYQCLSQQDELTENKNTTDQLAQIAKTEYEDWAESILNDINRYTTDKAEQQTRKNTAIQLKRSLEQEDETAGNLAAIEYLTLIIAMAEQQMEIDDDMIERLTVELNTLNAASDSLWNKWQTAQNVADEALLNWQNNEDAINELQTNLDIAIETWNNSLKLVKLYLSLLQQIHEVKELGVDGLIAQATAYQNNYNILINAYNSLSQLPNSAFNSYESLKLAFNKLQELAVSWAKTLADYEDIEAPVVVPEPESFNREQYNTAIERAWANFIDKLSIAYQAEEWRLS